MGCTASQSVAQVDAIREIDGGSGNLLSDNSVAANQSTKSPSKSPTKSKKKGWSLFSFKKNEDAEEEKEIRPKPQ